MRKTVAFCCSWLSLVLLTTDLRASAFSKGLASGSYGAGLKVWKLEDESRPYRSKSGKSAARPLQLVVFYPAEKGSGREQTYRDLLRQTCGYRKLEMAESDLAACESRLEKELIEYRPEKKGEAPGILQTKLGSRADAKAIGGEFPVILFDGGMTSDALSYFALCEYLATHGYIAISIPSLPYGEEQPLAFDLTGIESKARDILFVIRNVDRVPGASKTRIAVAAWSVGGVSATLAQMQEPKIQAVVSLDGGMGYDYGPKMASESKSFDPSKARVPYLHITGRKPNPYPVAKDFSFFDRVASQHVYRAEVEGINHSHFVVQGGVLPYANDPDKEAAEFWRANAALSGLVLDFLDVFLKGGTSPTSFVSAANAKYKGTASVFSSKSGIRDVRDGNAYSVLRVGGLQWLGTNARYASRESWCFDDVPEDCERNGRLYTWSAATEACPDGWRLPSDQDWMRLEMALGMTEAEASMERARGSDQGARLRTGGNSGLNFPISGYRRPDGTYARRGERAAFWTSTEANAEDAWHRDVRSDTGTIYRSPVTKTYALSVRCVRD